MKVVQRIIVARIERYILLLDNKEKAMNAKFSPSLNVIYPENMIEDGSYGDSLPSDLTELTEEEMNFYWKVSPPDNKRLGSKMDVPRGLIYLHAQRKN